MCGHQFPASFVRSRDHMICSCGMRIGTPGMGSKPRTSAIALLLIGAAIVLLTAAAALARLLVG